MAEVVTLQIPQRVTYRSTSELSTRFFANDYSKQQPKKIVFDLSPLEYFDTEGLGYLVLLPFYLRLFCSNIEVKLPHPNNRVASFFSYSRALNILVDNFRTPGISVVEDYNFLQKRYPRIQRSIKSNVDVFEKQSFVDYLHRGMEHIRLLIEDNELWEYFSMCFYELTQNIFEHSGETMGSFSFQYQTSKGTRGPVLDVAITDIGIGIKRTLLRNSQIKQGKDDTYYLEQAITEGISGTSERERGIGLKEVVQYESQVQITSGGGVIQTYDGNIIKRTNTIHSRRGTSIFISIEL